MNRPTIQRRLVRIGSRVVHVRHAGAGPRLLLIHGSPASGEYFAPLMRKLLDRYCCIAPDTPGFGESSALPEAQMNITGLAQATAELLETLQCAPCLVLGSHTGAAIAMELAVTRPDLVSGVIFDGLPLFTDQEKQAWFEGYFEALHIDARGGHYARSWTRIRDMFIWFPWTQHAPDNLNGTDLPSATVIHRWVCMLYQNASSAGRAYRSAVDYGPRGHAAATQLACPAVYLAQELDMLAPHLQRLPKLKDIDQVQRISVAPGAWLQSVLEHLGRLTTLNMTSRGELGALASDPADYFDDSEQALMAPGQWRVRRYGRTDLPALLLLHDVPGSGSSLHALALQLSVHLDGRMHIVVPDLPGYGATSALTTTTPSLEDFARTTHHWLTHSGITPRVIYGRGSGAMLAAQLALLMTRDSHMPCQLLLDEPPLVSAGITLDEHLCPPISISHDGAHWFRTWQMLRDSQVFWPWHQTSSRHLLRLPVDFNADTLHQRVLQIMQQPETAHCLTHAAIRYDLKANLMPLPATSWILLARAGHPVWHAAQSLATSLGGSDCVALTDANRAEVLHEQILRWH